MVRTPPQDLSARSPDPGKSDNTILVLEGARSPGYPEKYKIFKMFSELIICLEIKNTCVTGKTRKDNTCGRISYLKQLIMWLKIPGTSFVAGKKRLRQDQLPKNTYKV